MAPNGTFRAARLVRPLRGTIVASVQISLSTDRRHQQHSSGRRWRASKPSAATAGTALTAATTAAAAAANDRTRRCVSLASSPVSGRVCCDLFSVRRGPLRHSAPLTSAPARARDNRGAKGGPLSSAGDRQACSAPCRRTVRGRSSGGPHRHSGARAPPGPRRARTDSRDGRLTGKPFLSVGADTGDTPVQCRHGGGTVKRASSSSPGTRPPVPVK